MSRGPTKPSSTRVALRIADGPGPAFLVAAAEALFQVDGVEIVLIVVTPSIGSRSSTDGWVHTALEAAYDRLERRLLRGGPAALSVRQVSLPSGVPTVVETSSTRLAEIIKAADVNVLVDLVADDQDAILPIPPDGRWRLRFAEEIGGVRRSLLARPSRSTGLAESLLSIELASGSLVEAERGVSALRRIGFGRDRDAVYWRSSLLPARRLARLPGGSSVPTSGIDHPAPPTSDGVMEPQMAARPPFLGLASTLVGKVVERLLFRSGWLVLVRQRDPDGPTPRDLTGFEPIHAPAGRFYADPFVMSTPTGPELYVEDCPDGAHRGRISVLERGRTGRWEHKRVVLDDIDHRAYPHVVRTPAGIVVTPDGGRAGGVDLFLARARSGALEPLGRCLEGVAASDPTLLWHDDRYWLFVAVTGPGMNPWDELHVYFATTVDGLWHPHPRNPVVADVRCARPAGRIFRRGDDLVRPGQDCSQAYGQRIALSAITTLTPDEYEEHPIGSIEPEGLPQIRRTHTYTFDGSVEALDGYGRVPRWPGRAARSR